MALAAGTRVGPYEILALIGAGGMGEVYRARDTKLKRDVALKVLPEVFSLDPERMARFQREAELLASLNHPNIAQIYGVEERAIAMELVEGQTLQGPVPMETALLYAKQIADALEYAHERGVIHRDLKPANVKVSADGVVKVLDFGLAKAVEEPGREGGDPSVSPTLTLGHTQLGVVMGTAAYMAPEQAAGAKVDRRADIWSFGAVLYEMLIGKRAFDGSSVADTLATVMKVDPNWNALPAATPPSLVRLLRRCLTRDRKQRLQAIGEARIAVEAALSGKEPEIPEPSMRAARWYSSKAVPVGAAVSTLAMLVLALVAYRHLTEETRTLKLTVLPPENATIIGNSLPAVSPDGHRVAFAATVDRKRSLWIRELDSLAAHPLAGTEGATDPFWSPDSRFLAFFAEGKLKKIDLNGGPALNLCDAAGFRGGSWSNRDVILFTPDLADGLLSVPAAGGDPSRVSAVDRASGENSHRWPWFLPDGHHFLYTVRNNDAEKSAIYVADLDSKDRRRVLAANSNSVYAAPGYLLYVRDRTLMAQPFDAAKAQTTGYAIPVASPVDYVGVQMQGQFSSSQNGVLAYSSGSLVGGSTQLTWLDRSGKVVGTVGAIENWREPAISPDGKTVAAARQDPQTGVLNLWLHDLARNAASRFTFNFDDSFPAWSPDGSRIAFYSNRSGIISVYQKAVSGVPQDEAVDKTQPGRRPTDWSRDGHYLIEGTVDPKTKNDIWVLPLFGERKPFPYLKTEFDELNAKLSPGAQWLAYQSDESKRNEVYVQSFPTPGGKSQISTNGGSNPVWSRDGKELFFIGADLKMMAVEVKDPATRNPARFEAGVPKPLFDTGLRAAVVFAVSQDGRFLLPIPAEQARSVPWTVIVNWPSGLKK